jgi:ribose transport system substrate-binding protein
MIPRHPNRRLLAFSLSLAAVVLTACGTGASSSAPAGSASTAAASKQAAEEILAPYEGHPGQFPVTEPLDKSFPPGKKIAYVDNGNALVALIFSLMQPAAAALGIGLVRVQAGTSASEVQAAYNSVVQMKPDAVINTAIDPTIWDVQRAALVKEGVPIVSLGTVSTAAGLTQPNSTAAFERQGRLQAAWVISNGKAHPVLYVTPEVAYSTAVEKGFTEGIKELCSSCSSRVVDIPIAEVGSTAPDHIVSDLRAHPDTDAIVVQTSSIVIGLPAKLTIAGLQSTPIVGANPLPTNLQYLKDGQEAVEIGSDANVLAWTAVDTAARLIIGQKLGSNVQAGSALVQEVVTKQDLTFDISKGYIGYTDTAARFKRLWR